MSNEIQNLKAEIQRLETLVSEYEQELNQLKIDRVHLIEFMGQVEWHLGRTKGVMKGNS